MLFGKTLLREKGKNIALNTGDRRLIREIQRAGDNGSWITMKPLECNGTELSSTEFRDHADLRYGKDTIHLQHKCDGCGG